MINEQMLGKDSLMEIVSSSRLCLVGGKGGVGKTTIAAALAATLARRKPKKEILLVSLDSSHSLSHLFHSDFVVKSNNSGGDTLYTRKKFLSGIDNLGILELDFSALTQGFQTEYGLSIESLVEQGTLLSDSDIQAFVDVSLPALGEVMALMEITELLDQGTVDHLIVDAAPTGHTIRLLELPQFLRYLSEALTLMDNRRDLVMSSLIGRSVASSNGEAILDTLTARAEALRKLLKDSKQSGVIVIALAERLPLLETNDLIAELKGKDVPMKAVIVNKMAVPDCSFCQVRYISQRGHLSKIDGAFTGIPQFALPQLVDEPRTVDALATLMRSIEPLRTSTSAPESDFCVGSESGSVPVIDVAVTGQLPDFVADGLKLVIFAGKGGVGKTSLGAASALVLAQRHPEKRILIASIDPAHSLGDSLGTTLSTAPKQVVNNLWAAEVNAKELLADFKQIYSEEMNSFLTGLLPGGDSTSSAGISMGQDQEIAEKLINLETPDLDEFMVFRWLTQLRTESHFDIVFVDPAPAGHLLRFLELPAIATHWIKACLTVINKHNAIEKTQRTVRELLSLVKAIRTFEEELRRHNETTLIAVATPQEVVLAGMYDMLQQLDKYDVRMDAMVINMIRPDNLSCAFCHKLHLAQSEQIELARAALTQLNLVTVTQTNTDIQGTSALSIVGEALYG